MAIEKAAKNGCRVFYFGGYGDFDNLCYTIVTKIKNENPLLEIKLIYCVSQEKYLRKRTRYFKPEDYDDVIYILPAFEGWYKSIYFRNCAMIDQSDVIIFFVEPREDSGAYKAYKYAIKQKDKQIINIF